MPGMKRISQRGKENHGRKTVGIYLTKPEVIIKLKLMAAQKRQGLALSSSSRARSRDLPKGTSTKQSLGHSLYRTDRLPPGLQS